MTDAITLSGVGAMAYPFVEGGVLMNTPLKLSIDLGRHVIHACTRSVARRYAASYGQRRGARTLRAASRLFSTPGFRRRHQTNASRRVSRRHAKVRAPRLPKLEFRTF